MRTDNVDRADGRFCWADLKTKDPGRTAGFLAAVLGWGTRTDDVLGRARTFLTSGGYDVGGLGDLSAPVYPPGIPEHTAHYLAVADLRSAVANAVRSGAQVVVPAFELGTYGGGIATLVDPWGCAVSLWCRTGRHGWTHPPGTQDLPARLYHRGPDPAAAQVFYRDAFGFDDPGAVFSTLRTEGEDTGWELTIGVRASAEVAARACAHGSGRWVPGADAHTGTLVAPDGLRLRVETVHTT